MRPQARFCKNGHDTHVTGRYSGHTCIACKRTGQPNGRPPARYCVNGHDKDVVGRTQRGDCLQCNRDSERRRYRKRMGLPADTPPRQLFSSRPILAQIRLHGSWADHVTSFNVTDGDRSVARQYAMAYPDTAIESAERTLQRMRSGARLSMESADRWACFLGFHPCLLWDNWFDGVMEEVA